MQVLKCWNPIGTPLPSFAILSLYIVLFFVLQEPLRTQLPKDMMTFYLLAPSNRGTVSELGILVYIVPANTKDHCVSFKRLKLKKKINILEHHCEFTSVPQCAVWELKKRQRMKNNIAWL